jgi:hypothetical protein
VAVDDITDIPGAGEIVEGMAVLWINNRISSRPEFDYHLRQTE